MDSNRSAWLAGLTVGSKVVVLRTWESAHYGVVVRLTPTQVLVKAEGQTQGEGSRFRRKDGEEVGVPASVWNVRSIVEPTPEWDAQIRWRSALHSLAEAYRRNVFVTLDRADVLALADLVKAAVARRDAKRDAEAEAEIARAER